MSDNNNTVIIVQNNHTYATEFLIIVSQTVFFVLLFILMKSALIDRRGMMHSYERIQEEKLQLGALFFAIFVFIAIIMIPLESYEFVHFVIPITYFIIIALVLWEINAKYKNRDTIKGHVKSFDFSKPAPESAPVSSPPKVVVSSTSPGTAFDY